MVWLLLCLLLVAKSSIAAVLSVSGAAGYEHPASDVCPFVGLFAFVGPHDAAAVHVDAEPLAIQESEGGALPLHHHHTCPQLCQMQAAAPAPLAMPAACQASVPLPALSVFTSVDDSPPVHPPRARG